MEPQDPKASPEDSEPGDPSKKWAGKLLHVGPEGAHLALQDHRKGSNDTCWCQPELKQGCLACLAKWEADKSVEVDSSDCEACGGQGVVGAFDETKPVIVVHRVAN